MRAPSILVAADVFGITPELRLSLAPLEAAPKPPKRGAASRKRHDHHLIEAEELTITFVSPHPFNRTFRDETEGYAAFVEAGGVAAYAARVREALEAAPHCFDLALGFSAGATALWLCLADAELEPWLPKRAELYYGSRIREHAHLEPRRQTRLIFAEKEASFDPAELAARLRGLGHNALVIPGSAHGFMNALSPGYDAALHKAELARIQALLAHLFPQEKKGSPA
ncbi:dienelactone hydrolase family protein [Humidesulfovibrio idahonensis]